VITSFMYIYSYKDAKSTNIDTTAHYVILFDGCNLFSVQLSRSLSMIGHV